MHLIDTLADRGVLSEAERARALEVVSAASDRPPHLTLLEKGFVKEENLFPALADEFGLQFVDLTQTTVDPQALAGIPQKLVHKKNLMPIARSNGTLVVATGDPFDSYALDELQTITGLQIHPVLGSPKEIARLLKTHFGIGGDNVAAIMATAKQDDDIELLENIEADDSEAAKAAQEATVVGLVNKILTEAAAERASDIHIEHEESGIKIRYRIDGLLQEQRLPAEINRLQAAIVSRLKIMARLNIAEKRLPQDGRIKMKVQGREVDVRVSIIPMVHGEGICMRLLDKGRMVFNLKNIGFVSDYDKKFRQMIDRPHGIVIVTGPTGSGKSTTLYSALNEVKDETTKIITVEDPVEYQQPGICQIQTHAKIGLTFASSLRSILRHDPDVILIGEMRDLETAEAAIQASLTGHLVFSTLHTNDAPSSITRLRDMGVEPFLITACLEAIQAQRLVRKVCTFCRTWYEPTRDQLMELNLSAEQAKGKKMAFGEGCDKCNSLGFKGRTGLYELMLIDDDVRDMIGRGASTDQLREYCMTRGMRTLREDGLRKLFDGMTTLEEIVREVALDD